MSHSLREQHVLGENNSVDSVPSAVDHRLRQALVTGELNSEEFTLADFYYSPDKELFSKARLCYDFIEDVRRRGGYQYQRPLLSACENRVWMQDDIMGCRRRMIMLASNNYLGLATHPQVVKAGQAAIAQYGSGLCGSPMLSGTTDLTKRLEARLAKFMGYEDAIVFSTGYSANVGAISGLIKVGDVAVIDKTDHASIVDGCRLAEGQMRAFKHNDLKNLEAQLKRCQRLYNGKLIIVDGVFSMDGDICPLPGMVELASKYGASVLVDEAHALGVLGPNGGGVTDHFQLQDKVDIVLGTFSKSLCGTGGFVAASKEIVNYLRYYARSYMFSAAPAPAVMAMVLAALEVMQQEPERRERLWDNIRYLHAGLKELGLTVLPDPPQSPVILVEIGNEVLLREVSRRLHIAGIYTNAVPYPAVPRDKGRIRISVMATHTRQDLDETIAEFKAIGQSLQLIAPHRLKGGRIHHAILFD